MEDLDDKLVPRSLLEEDNENETKKNKKKSGGFESMNLSYPVFRAIKGKGFNVPTPIQRKAIPPLLEGRDVVACARTGSGKTAAFIIPMVNRLKEHSKIVGARALIILPTRELALQIVSVLKTFTKYTDLRHCLIVGGHGLEGQFEGLASNPDIIIATPGRLTQHINETGLTLSKVEFLIFDEADYLFEMGFAEQMKVILKKVSQNRQTLMFSATIPEQLSQFARAGLKEYVFCKLDQEYTLNENMEVNFVVCKPNEKIPTILYLLEKIIPKTESSIIFCPTKYHVDLALEIFDKYKISNVGIYGKMDQFQRKDAINEFKRKNVKCLVVTDLAARGIDMPIVSNVIHFDFPAQPKIFIHRSGRTARAGRSGKIYGLVSMNEVCYVSEILLFVGRKASNNKEEYGDNSKVFTGMIPSYFLTDYQKEIQGMLSDSPDLFKINDIATRAYNKFTKTRTSASKASIKNSHVVQAQELHPLFQDCEKDIQETQNILSQLRNYKPKESYIEILKAKSVKMGSSKIEEQEKLTEAIDNMKNIQRLQKQSIQKNLKIKQQQEDLKKEIEIEALKRQEEIQQKLLEKQKGNNEEKEGEGENQQENEEEQEDEDDDKPKEKSEEEIMRGMTKKQRKAYIKQKAQERRDNPEKWEQEQKEKQQKLKEQKEKEKNLKRKNSKDLEEQYQIEFTDQKQANIHFKRSELTDYKHPTQYISQEKQNNGFFEKDTQITSNDVQQFIVGEDPDEIMASRKRTVWDSKKKKYVMNQLPGQLRQQGRKDQEDMKHVKKDGGKLIFNKWQQKNQVRIQRDGEEEDQDNMYRAQNSFKKRSLQAKGYRFNSADITPNAGVKSELKRPGEILKQKKEDRKSKLKNMEKVKRNKVITKIQGHKQKMQKNKGRGGPGGGRGGPGGGRGGRGGGRGGSRGGGRGGRGGGGGRGGKGGRR